MITIKMEDNKVIFYGDDNIIRFCHMGHNEQATIRVDVAANGVHHHFVLGTIYNEQPDNISVELLDRPPRKIDGVK